MRTVRWNGWVSHLVIIFGFSFLAEAGGAARGLLGQIVLHTGRRSGGVVKDIPEGMESVWGYEIPKGATGWQKIKAMAQSSARRAEMCAPFVIPSLHIRFTRSLSL